MKQLLLDLSPAKPSLSNFVEGRNGEALQTLKDLASGRSQERMVYLWGEEGCGRTHLLQACSREAGPDARYVACVRDTRFDFDADFAAADDVENLDAEGQVSLFHFCNRIRERGGVLLASGSLPPSQLDLRPDLATRLAWGLVYQLHVLDDAEKREALERHAGMLGFELPHDVEDYMMHHVRRDLPTLVKMIDALDEYSRESKRPVTIPLLKEIMK